MASFTTAFVNLKESENYGCVQSEVIKYLNDPIQDISAQTTTDVIKVSGSIGNSILVNPKQLVNALSSIKSVNKTDATTLLSTFGSLGKIIKTSEENLVSCPGLGPNKATRLFKTLHQPFLKSGCLVNNKNLKNM
uniref:DisA/LigA helix-hairpin-helix motif domain-containing protein n=1 Tax=Clastoptera arizonana TaxID=38151 RepID=A0A1B6C3I1_9HEMI